MSHGSDVNALSNGNLTALHLAVNSRSEEPENVYMTVRYLLQAPGITHFQKIFFYQKKLKFINENVLKITKKYRGTYDKIHTN